VQVEAAQGVVLVCAQYMSFGNRARWFGRMAFRVFILASVTFLSALTAMRFAIQGREVAVPDVVAKQTQQAQAILAQRGLNMKVEDRMYSYKPVDAVVRQSPPPQMAVKRGQRVHVVLSLGPQRLTIPDLQQMSARAARIGIMRSGLQLGETDSVFLPEYPADTVLQQDPAPGTTDATSPHMDLLVSLGPRAAAYVMPDLIGLSAEEAGQRLGMAGLKLGKMTPVVKAGATPNNVVAQRPSAGARIEAGTDVEIAVAQEAPAPETPPASNSPAAPPPVASPSPPPASPASGPSREQN
jgi:eukaryotic-like serine/threonine-protein kinase